MPVQPSTVQLAEFRSWFDETNYTNRGELDAMLRDPIFELLGEDVSDNPSDTLATTGVDYSGFAKAKVPGGSVAKDAPVEADTHTIKYITFVQRFNYELETISHKKFLIDDPEGNALSLRLWEAVGLFLTNCIHNQNTATSFQVPTHGGSTLAYTITTPDGLAIISASHTGPGYTATTNIGGTGALSTSTLTTNIQVGNQGCRTAAGVAFAYEADAIMIGNVGSMFETATQITKSTLVPSSGNNAIQVYSGGIMDVIRLKYAPRTTVGAYDTAAGALYRWSTINKRNFKRMMKYKWNVRPMILQSKTFDDANLDYFRTAVCRLAFMPENPWCIVQNNATTAPVSSS